MNTSRTVASRRTLGPLLAFSGVSKLRRDGLREIATLDNVSFELGEGACVGLYGARRSGKSTLLRLACAIEPPDAGSIRFGGRDITRASARERAALRRGPIALLSADGWHASPGETLLDSVVTSVGASGLSLRQARSRALQTLDRVGLAGIAGRETSSPLSADERARTMLARSIVREPRLLVVDEPAPMPKIGERERFCALIRSLAVEQGMALLMASEEMAALQGMAVLMSISGGALCSTDEQGTVVELAGRRVATNKRK